MDMVTYISSLELLFTQYSISTRFSNGQTLYSFLEGLLKNEKIADNVEPLTVMMYKRKKYVIDGNRRLYLLKKLEFAGLVDKIKIKYVDYNEKKFKEKFTTKNEGKSVQVLKGAGTNREIEAIIQEYKKDKEDKTSNLNKNNLASTSTADSKAKQAEETSKKTKSPDARSERPVRKVTELSSSTSSSEDFSRTEEKLYSKLERETVKRRRKKKY